MLNGIADIMCFGALSLCDVCKNGQLFLNTNGYVCKGMYFVIVLFVKIFIPLNKE